jgi:hypothetical protein
MYAFNEIHRLSNFPLKFNGKNPKGMTLNNFTLQFFTFLSLFHDQSKVYSTVASSSEYRVLRPTQPHIQWVMGALSGM